MAEVSTQFYHPLNPYPYANLSQARAQILGFPSKDRIQPGESKDSYIVDRIISVSRNCLTAPDNGSRIGAICLFVTFLFCNEMQKRARAVEEIRTRTLRGDFPPRTICLVRSSGALHPLEAKWLLQESLESFLDHFSQACSGVTVFDQIEWNLDFFLELKEIKDSMLWTEADGSSLWEERSISIIETLSKQVAELAYAYEHANFATRETYRSYNHLLGGIVQQTKKSLEAIQTSPIH